MSSPVDTDLTHLDAVELGRRLAAGETSSVEPYTPSNVDSKGRETWIIQS